MNILKVQIFFIVVLFFSCAANQTTEKKPDIIRKEHLLFYGKWKLDRVKTVERMVPPEERIATLKKFQVDLRVIFHESGNWSGVLKEKNEVSVSKGTFTVIRTEPEILLKTMESEPDAGKEDYIILMFEKNGMVLTFPEREKNVELFMVRDYSN